MIRAKEVLLRFLAALDGTGIPYAIGGSLASGLHGEPRATHDFDLLVDLRPEQILPLVRALGAGFYADVPSIREALQRKSSFNVIHKESAQKIDVFVSSQNTLDREQMERRVAARLEAGDPEIFVTSAEMILLRKLDWYRRGGSASERQLRDVVAVLRQQRGRLDEPLLERLAAELDLTELLLRVRDQAD